MASERYLTFSVSRAEDGTVMGQASGCVMHEDGRAATFLSQPYGIPAKEAFPQAVALARQHDIAQVHIDDPNGLFSLLEYEGRPI